MVKMHRPADLVKDLYEWGLSTYRIARESGVSQSEVYRILKGITKRAGVETEQKLRALYDKYIGDEQ